MRLPKTILNKMDPPEVKMIDEMAEKIETLSKKTLPDFYVHDHTDRQILVSYMCKKILETSPNANFKDDEVREGIYGVIRRIGILPAVPKGNVFKLNKENVRQPPEYFCTINGFAALV